MCPLSWGACAWPDIDAASSLKSCNLFSASGGQHIIKAGCIVLTPRDALADWNDGL